MSSPLFGGFADREFERAFLADERRTMLPYLRLFGAVMFVNVLLHMVFGLLDFDAAKKGSDL